MDKYAIEVYRNLSQATQHKALSEFWNQMSQEESKHVMCWSDLLPLVEEKIIPQIFSQPDVTLKELEENYSKIIEISNKSKSSMDLTENFILAFRLEFYLLHPALERLWNFYGVIKQKAYNPVHEYENHVRQFITAMHKFGAATIELEALGETVERMWHHTTQMAHEANVDELTEILNRRGLFNAMTSLAYLAKRNEFNSAILMIDIDHFKQVNDTLGHQKGDVVLKEIASIIKSNIRASDILGRFGGEEFIVFLPQITNKGIHPLSEKIRLAVQETTKKSIPVTISIGGASKKFKGEIDKGIHELIKQADTYLYQAKREGRNQTIC